MSTIGDLFANENVRYCREAVRNSQCKEFSFSEDTVVGYEYVSNGYGKTYFRGTCEAIAEFICKNDRDKLLTTGDDFAILNTQGYMLDLARVSEPCRKQLLVALVPLQKKYEGDTDFDC